MKRLQKAADIDAAENHSKKLLLSNDRDRDEQPGTASQHGDGNRQFNNFGTGPQKNVDGNYFEAKGDQHFGMVPPRSRWGERGCRRRPALLTMMAQESITRNRVAYKSDPRVHSHEYQAYLCRKSCQRRNSRYQS
ncbi:hypothetical protein B0T22DRAFT_121460 [Podospora appendiculata]|uniref:Uncharacterized protein n=1 Tax=Podospora appendiculata TaxID=314037 RepID=A0AAE0X6Y9_9PEZI|nr:hypothetical protein B0T22DRAFT_121460 [Podospora appendiculata]